MQLPTIIIDTSEKKPWKFGGGNTSPARRFTAIRRKLDTGDYSFEGYEDQIAVERKSINDLGNCLGGDRLRFEGQLLRLRKIKYRAVVIEAGMADILRGGYFSKLPPDEFLRRITGLMVRYRVMFLLGGSVNCARKLALSFMVSSWRQLDK